ncbi:hypothetical protein A0256_13635 [Mucilaginibacter sp. PAMC 26640]|nr:hypothetical protein A0256_13635 [Mucilaginibacter sp. PAMC 26640]
MAGYKINGYDLQSALGIIIDQDRATADSFEGPSGTMPVFSKDWGNGFIEFDLAAPAYIKPKVLTLKGTLTANSLEEYYSTKSIISGLLHQNYVTLTQIESSYKVNARLKDGDLAWHRLTNLDSSKILASFTWQFDEVKQDVPFKDDDGSANANVHYGPSPTVPVTSADVLALPSHQSISSDTFTLNTGTAYTNFTFAIPVSRAVVSVTDLEEGVTLNYTYSPITVDGQSYKLYTLSQNVTYLTNHSHKIIFQNV